MKLEWRIQPKPNPGKEQVVRALDHKILRVENKFLSPHRFDRAPLDSPRLSGKLAGLKESRANLITVPEPGAWLPIFDATRLEGITEIHRQLRATYKSPHTAKKLTKLGTSLWEERALVSDQIHPTELTILTRASHWCTFWGLAGYGMIPNY